ncbi:hypothetical protein EI94DRAFT_1104469 [Lactarius quietus]|nr:hypothetical protein EI94DRAFT_1104469 [Lactarius quietus]
MCAMIIFIYPRAQRWANAPNIRCRPTIGKGPDCMVCAVTIPQYLLFVFLVLMLSTDMSRFIYVRIRLQASHWRRRSHAARNNSSGVRGVFAQFFLVYLNQAFECARTSAPRGNWKPNVIGCGVLQSCAVNTPGPTRLYVSYSQVGCPLLRNRTGHTPVGEIAVLSETEHSNPSAILYISMTRNRKDCMYSTHNTIMIGSNETLSGELI